VSQKNDTDVAHYNFNEHYPILVNFCRNVAVAIKWRFVIPRLLASVSALPGEHEPQKFGLFSHALYRK